MFSIISKFTDAGISWSKYRPLITDSEEEIDATLDNCYGSGVGYVFGAPLRLSIHMRKNANNSKAA
jgi:hypothetical protein